MLQQDKVHDRPGSLRDRIGQWSSPHWKGVFPTFTWQRKNWIWNQFMHYFLSVQCQWCAGLRQFGAESGSKFKFGFRQLPPKFITPDVFTKTCSAISYFHWGGFFSKLCKKINKWDFVVNSRPSQLRYFREFWDLPIYLLHTDPHLFVWPAWKKSGICFLLQHDPLW